MSTEELKSPYEWTKFCTYIQKTNRYVLSSYWNKFIDAVLLTAKKREIYLKKGMILVRARIGSHYEEFEDPEEGFQINIGPLQRKDIVAPPPNKAKDGRINPRGISYLYLSNDEDTSILEVRPWIKQEVTVGYFEITKKLKCIDTSRDKKGTYFYIEEGEPEISPETKEEYVWSGINNSFSKPIRPGDEPIDYIPTQYLSECFKNSKYDGIVYKSSLTEKGYNVVLFNPKFARLKGAKIFQIKSLKHTKKECGNPYSCKYDKE